MSWLDELLSDYKEWLWLKEPVGVLYEAIKLSRVLLCLGLVSKFLFKRYARCWVDYYLQFAFHEEAAWPSVSQQGAVQKAKHRPFQNWLATAHHVTVIQHVLRIEETFMARIGRLCWIVHCYVGGEDSGVPRGGFGVFKPPPPKFWRYRWSPRSHKQEEPASRFPFAVHYVLVRL